MTSAAALLLLTTTARVALSDGGFALSFCLRMHVCVPFLCTRWSLLFPVPRGGLVLVGGERTVASAPLTQSGHLRSARGSVRDLRPAGLMHRGGDHVKNRRGPSAPDLANGSAGAARASTRTWAGRIAQPPHAPRAREQKKKKAPFCAQHRARPPSAPPGCPAAHREAPKGSAWAPCPRSSRTSRRRTPRRASGPLKKSWASVCGADAEQPHARGRVSDAKGSPVPLAVPSLSRTPPRRHWPRRRLVSHSHSRKDLAPAQKPHLRKRGRRCRQEAAASLSSGAMGTAQHSPVRGDHRRSGGCRHVAPAATGASTSNQRFLFSFLPRTRAVVLVAAMQ